MRNRSGCSYFLFTQRQSEDMSVLAQDYPSVPANPSSLAKRDARGFCGQRTKGLFAVGYLTIEIGINIILINIIVNKKYL